MTIRAIDLQVLIPRATEVGKVQQVTDHQTSLQQQQMGEQWQRIAANRQQQVQRRPQTAGGKVEPDAQENQKGRDADHNKDGRGRAGGDDEPEDSQDPLRGHHIDIKT